MTSNTESVEKVNYDRALYLSKSIADKAVRIYFDKIHPPLQLVNDLRAEKTNLQKFSGQIFSPLEWEKMYPPAGHAQPDSTDFDITLMICLLRYMHPIIPAPPYGYGTLPHSSHTTAGAHLARIKYYRNQLTNSYESKLSTTEFTILCNDLTVAIVGLGGSQFIKVVENVLDMNRRRSRGLRNLGMGTIDELNNMLKENSYECYWNRIYLVGPYGVGKTTLAKLLVGDPIPDTWESTDGIWIYLGRAGMDVEKRKWVFLKKGTVINAAVMSMLKTKANKTLNADISGDRVTLKEDVMSAAGNKKTNVEIEHQDSGDLPHNRNDKGHIRPHEKPEDEIVDEDILNLIIKKCEKGNYRMIIVPIDIWDFGGQKIYYMTHQLFISSRGTFVVIFNGSIDLHSETNDLLFLPGRKDHNTYAGYLMHWVNSILTYCDKTKTADDIVYPRIMFVATHKDKVLKVCWLDFKQHSFIQPMKKRSEYIVKCINYLEDVCTRLEILRTSLQDLFQSHAGRHHLMIDQLFL